MEADIDAAEVRRRVVSIVARPDTFNVGHVLEPDDEPAALERFRPMEGE